MNIEKRFRIFQKNWKQGRYKRVFQNIGLCAATACIVLLAVYFVRGNKAEREIALLRELKNQEMPQDNADGAVPKVDDKEISVQYRELFLQNPDLVGWVMVDGTKIDYPVMWTPEEPEFYSHRGFDKKESQNGLPFMDQSSNISEYGGNLIIYGHNMKNGSIFADLLKYTDKTYWETHKNIQFDTLHETRIYKIFAVAKGTDVNSLPYGFTKASETDCVQALEKINALKLYDTGENAIYGDDFITLSTCDYNSADGRIMVMARRVQ